MVDALGIGGLLGRHVVEGADDLPGAGQAVGLVHLLGDAEVGEQRMLDRAEDVLGLEVAVDDAVAMGVIEGGGDAAHHMHRLGQRQLGVVIGARRQIHDHEGHVPVLAPFQIQALGRPEVVEATAVHRMHGDDVGVIPEALGQFGLLQEAPVTGCAGTGVAHLDGEAGIRRQDGAQHLLRQDRLLLARHLVQLGADHLALVGRVTQGQQVDVVVLGLIDLTHAATAQAAYQPPQAQRLPDHGVVLVAQRDDAGLVVVHGGTAPLMPGR